MAELPAASRRGRGAGLVAACIAIVVAARASGLPAFDDPFHQGEYFAALQALLHPRDAGFLPLTIHGALDFLPALLARALWGPERYFLPTHALYQLTNMLASFVFIATAWELVRGRELRGWLVVGAAVAASRLVGYRDLFLLVALYLFVLGTRRALLPRSRALVQVALGTALAVGLFWSYDRGIAAGVSFVAGTLVLLPRERWRWIAPVTFVVATLALGAVYAPFSLRNYVESVTYFFHTAAKWEAGEPSLRLRVTLFIVTANVVAFAAYLRVRLAEAPLATVAGEATALGLAAAFMARIALNRADLDHLDMGLWMPMLLAFAALGREVRHGIVLEIATLGTLAGAAIFVALWRTVSIGVACAALAFAVFRHRPIRGIPVASLAFRGIVAASLVYYAYLAVGTYRAGYYDWWRPAIAHAPSNEEVVFPGIRWAARELRARNVPCVFDLANNGVIAGLVERPACSRFTLPLYAGAGEEHELIETLAARHPDAIVYSTIYWSYKLDDIDMPTRYPALDAFVRARYPHESCQAGYCVRTTS